LHFHLPAIYAYTYANSASSVANLDSDSNTYFNYVPAPNSDTYG
jgi:hypothetical protein